MAMGSVFAPHAQARIALPPSGQALSKYEDLTT